MIYRPQFAFSTPPGFRDQQFHYSFDGSNVAAFAASKPIPAGGQLNNITLQLQNDAEFICRAIKVQLGTSPSTLYLQIRSPFGHFLSTARQPLGLYLTGGGSSLIGRMLVPIEDEIRCPAGGFLQVDLTNLTAGPVACPAFTLFGVKRYQLPVRRQAA